MRIYQTDDPMQALWEIVSPLASEIKMYKQVMDEDEDSVPESYLLLRPSVSDAPSFYGDGNTQLRKCSCNLTLVSKSKGATTDDIHCVNQAKVEALLKVSDVRYTGYNLGYDATLKSSEYAWSVEFIYG